MVSSLLLLYNLSFDVDVWNIYKSKQDVGTIVCFSVYLKFLKYINDLTYLEGK